jgi:hypothetical protein
MSLHHSLWQMMMTFPVLSVYTLQLKNKWMIFMKCHMGIMPMVAPSKSYFLGVLHTPVGEENTLWAHSCLLVSIMVFLRTKHLHDLGSTIIGTHCSATMRLYRWKLLHNNGNKHYCWNIRLHYYATMGIMIIVRTQLKQQELRPKFQHTVIIMGTKVIVE